MTKLTPADEDILAKVDQYHLRSSITEIRQDNGEPDTVAALMTDRGKAVYLLREMAAMVRRMDKDSGDE
jgi:hypothetical protein